MVHFFQRLYVLVDCVECLTSRQMYEYILNELGGQRPSEQVGYSNAIRCDNMNDFIRNLRKIQQDNSRESEALYLVRLQFLLLSSRIEKFILLCTLFSCWCK